MKLSGKSICPINFYQSTKFKFQEYSQDLTWIWSHVYLLLFYFNIIEVRETQIMFTFLWLLTYLNLHRII